MFTAALFQCDVCQDRGVVSPDVPVGHALFGKALPCPSLSCEAGNQRRKLIFLNKFKRAGLPETYRDLTFASFEAVTTGQEKGKALAYAAARHFCDVYPSRFTLREAVAAYVSGATWFQPQSDSPRYSLVLTGDNGGGKTGLVASMFNELLARDVYPLYIRVQDMIAEVQETYGRGNTEEKYYSLITAPLLILDEFNIEKYSEDRLEIVERVVRGRHGRGLPFIATTNLNNIEFDLRWGRRIGDIILTAHWVGVAGAKLRDTVAGVEAF